MRMSPRPRLFTCSMFAFILAIASSMAAVELKVDPKPISKELKAATSHAPMLKTITPSVVNIFTTRLVKASQMPSPFGPRFNDRGNEQTRKQSSLGSGVIITSDGYIVTNNHVVAESDEIKVALSDGETEYDAELVGRDPKTDIAVLKVKAKDLPAITLTSSEGMEVGDLVFAIGNPFGIGQTVTQGIVSAVGRGGLGITDYEDFIQTDASINPGNSGGALIDAEGRLVGVNTAIVSRTGGNNGIGFAVPVDLAVNIINQLIDQGKVARGYLGVAIQEITPQLATQFGLEETTGALVSDVTADSAAEEGGVKVGDVIISVDDYEVTDVRHLRLLIARLIPGQKTKVTVLRDGKKKKLTVVLKAWPDEEGDEVASLPSGPIRAIAQSIQLQELDGELRKQLEIPKEIDGVVVANVAPNSEAAEAGLRRGDIILEVNRKSADSVRKTYEAIASAKDGNVLLYVWTRGFKRWVPIKLNND